MYLTILVAMAPDAELEVADQPAAKRQQTKKPSSDVFAHHEVLKEQNDLYAACNYCKQILKYARPAPLKSHLVGKAVSNRALGLSAVAASSHQHGDCTVGCSIQLGHVARHATSQHALSQRSHQLCFHDDQGRLSIVARRPRGTPDWHDSSATCLTVALALQVLVPTPGMWLH
jgi:hypothetical protein